MDERQFYTEKEETRKVKLICPSCRGEFEAPVRWKVCRKKRELPRGIGEEDKKKFAKASSYMVRPVHRSHQRQSRGSQRRPRKLRQPLKQEISDQ
jgi:hypothetical protein